jgi:hypothetical protein
MPGRDVQGNPANNRLLIKQMFDTDDKLPRRIIARTFGQLKLASNNTKTSVIMNYDRLA